MFSRFGAYAENLKIDYFKDWDTRKVTTMKNMFAYTFSECYVGVYENIIKNPSVIDLTGLDSDSLTVVDSLFSFNIKVNEIIGIENLDFSKVESLVYVFMMVGYHLENTMSLNLSNSNFSNVNSLSGTFLDSSFDRIVFHWNSEISSEFSNTFHGVKLNELIISAEKNVTFKDTIGTFGNIKLSGTLDLSEFNFKDSTNYFNMFAQDDLEKDYPSIIDLSGSDWNEEADTTGMFKNIVDVTIYVKDEKAKAFIEKQAPDCTVLIKDKE